MIRSRSISISISALAAVALLTSTAALSLAAAGRLDLSFDDDGIAFSPPGPASATSVAIQPDGKIVVAGCSQCELRPRFAVYRYNADGSRDLTFGGGDGIVKTGFRGDATAYDVALQADGKIVAAGVAIGGSSRPSFALARFDTEGNLDATFGGGDGKVRTRIGFRARATAVAIQADGKIVAGGSTGSRSLADHATLVRYEANGDLDPSFGGDGVVETTLNADPFSNFQDVIVLPNGRIVGFGDVFAATGQRFLSVRYLPSGELDRSFGRDGITTTSLGGDSSGASIARAPDGKLVAAGYVTRTGQAQRFAVARYSDDGTLDATFSHDGKVTTSVGANEALAGGVVVQPDLKIVVVGICCFSSRLALVRYLEDGSLDRAFDGGRATLKVGVFASGGRDVALQTDGKIVVLGNFAQGGERFVLARYRAS